jgi:hypothetical protein
MQNTASSPNPVVAKPVFAWPKPDTRPVVTFQAWASYALVAIVVAGLTLGIGRATNFFDSSTPPPTNEDTIPFQGVFNIDGTPVPMGESSSFPVPNELNCTVEPLTRDEVVAHLEAANFDEQQTFESYERAIVPTDEDAQAIMNTYRTWQACQSGDHPMATYLALETPHYTAQFGLVAAKKGATGDPTQPLSDERIQEMADEAVLDSDVLLLTPPPTLTTEEVDAQITAEATAIAQRVVVPLPDGATPVTYDPTRFSISTIFASDIVIAGPNVALVMAVSVDAETGEILNSGQNEIRFVKVDGIWKIDQESRASRG